MHKKKTKKHKATLACKLNIMFYIIQDIVEPVKSRVRSPPRHVRLHVNDYFLKSQQICNLNRDENYYAYNRCQ
jgi:hypothetical protein